MAALGAGIAGMKFAKLCEEACVELESQTKVPAFPYKALKKQLKKVLKVLVINQHHESRLPRS